MKRIIVLIFFIFYVFLCSAQEINKSEIEKVAKILFLQNEPNNKAENKPVYINELSNNDTILLYLVNNNTDFVLFANDLRVNPILGYSNEGTYDGENIPPQLKELLENYKNELLEIKRGKVKTERKYTNEWQKLLNSDFSGQKTSVFPIIKVNWNQGSGWNRFCPEDIDGPDGHVYAGCVAVSMAQSMSVYEHPAQGVGESSYFADEYGTLYANYQETEYKWDSMSNTVADDYNSLLLYHCAVSVKMGFSPDGSGAYTRDIANALRSYFDYSPNVYSTNSTNDQAWIDLLKSELDEGRPISYGGNNGSENGHAFNLDGYNSSDAFHVNWGWSGSYNGYFQITALTPGTNNFSYNAVAVLNIIPTDHSPTNIELSNYNFIEKLPVGTIVSVIHVEDPDENDEYSYSVEGTRPIGGVIYCPFYIDGDSLKNNELIENNFHQNIEIKITATDLQNNEFSKIFVLNVLKENYSPTNITINNTFLDDDYSIGSVVGILSTVDQDTVDTFTYTFEINENPEVGKDNDKFTISNDTLFTNFDFLNFEKNQCSIYLKSSDKKDEFVNKEIIIDIQRASGIFSLNEKNTLCIYPNPSNTGLFALDFSKLNAENLGKKYELKIFDLKGTLIKSISGVLTLNEISFQIDKKGFYFIQFSTENIIMSQKVFYQ